MREIHTEEITQAVRDLFIEANYSLPQEETSCILRAPEGETNPLARKVLTRLGDNLSAAQARQVPICQDTGMAVLFAEIGQDVHIVGGDFRMAVNEGVRRAYADGYMRCSVVRDPLLDRVNTGDNTPAVLHTEWVPGDRLHLIAAPKGFGSENMSALRMFTPASGKDEIVEYVASVVKQAGGNPCPPLLVGVGIGGTFELCAWLSKKALLRGPMKRNPAQRYAELEEEMLRAVNQTGVGPQGFGGDTTAFAVNIETYPTHIAGLPVAVNICCHVMRHADRLL